MTAGRNLWVDADFKKEHDDMYVDLYKGKDQDNPSVTTRLFLLEEFMRNTKLRDQKLFWLGVATLLAIIVDLVKGSIHH